MSNQHAFYRFTFQFILKNSLPVAASFLGFDAGINYSPTIILLEQIQIDMV
jgi:hypothetical protein